MYTRKGIMSVISRINYNMKHAASRKKYTLQALQRAAVNHCFVDKLCLGLQFPGGWGPSTQKTTRLDVSLLVACIQRLNTVTRRAIRDEAARLTYQTIEGGRSPSPDASTSGLEYYKLHWFLSSHANLKRVLGI